MELKDKQTILHKYFVQNHKAVWSNLGAINVALHTFLLCSKHPQLGFFV